MARHIKINAPDNRLANASDKERGGPGARAPGNYGEQAMVQAFPGHTTPTCERMTGFEPATLTLAR